MQICTLGKLKTPSTNAWHSTAELTPPVKAQKSTHIWGRGSNASKAAMYTFWPEKSKSSKEAQNKPSMSDWNNHCLTEGLTNKTTYQPLTMQSWVPSPKRFTPGPMKPHRPTWQPSGSKTHMWSWRLWNSELTCDINDSVNAHTGSEDRDFPSVS